MATLCSHGLLAVGLLGAGNKPMKVTPASGSSRAHSCSPMFSSFPPFLLLFAEGLRGAELSLLIEFTPKDIKLPQMLVLHPVASIHLRVRHSH